LENGQILPQHLFGKNLENRLDSAFQMVHQHFQQSTTDHKKFFDIGDQVLLYTVTTKHRTRTGREN
jgi:hypothetical protein